MSGGLLATMVAPHTPRIGIEANAPAFTHGMITGLREMGAVLRDMRPDLIVLQSSHWVSTFNWYVTAHEVHEGVCIADEAPDLIPGVPYRRPGDPEFARALAAAMTAAGIPCGINDTRHFKWDYGSMVPLQYMDPEQAIPVVLIPSVICSDLAENQKVGALVEEVARNTGKRVVFVASCALSHKVLRGPDLWPTDEMRQLDQRFIEMATRGEVGELLAWAPQYSRDAVAEMGGRPLNAWLGAMAALERARGPLHGKQYGAYGQSSGSGNVCLCVIPDAA